MDVRGKTVVVTGGASGIGAALVARFQALGARTYVIDMVQGSTTADHLRCDVSDPAALRAALGQIEDTIGCIDIYVSNAGVLSQGDAPLGDAGDWQRCWDVNVMAHVHAAHTLVPRMLGRGWGHFVVVASAAGLLNQIGDAPYSATKHAAVSFAESLAITHGPDGLRVTLVCPQYVATPMLDLSSDESHSNVLSAEDVAISTLAAMSEGRFLVLPHPEVQGYAISRATDPEKWINGMARLRAVAQDRFGVARPDTIYKLL